MSKPTDASRHETFGGGFYCMAFSRVRAMEAVAALLLCQMALRVVRFSVIARITGIATELATPPRLERTRDPVAATISRAICSASYRLPGHTCLAKALAGKLMLARRRVPSEVVLGVRRDSGSLDAHAWLAVADGTVCGGETAEAYEPIAALVNR